MSQGRLLRNATSNWLGYAAYAAVTLLLTPFVLRELGPGRYGVWILTSSIIGYYGLLDGGFRAGVTQYLTRYLAVGDHIRASESISSAVAVLSAIGAGLLGLSVIAAWVAPQLLNVSSGLEHEAFWCILIVGSASALQFALSPFASVFTATQRFDLANLIGVGTRVLTAGAIVLALTTGNGLIGVSVATCAVSALDYVVRWRVALRLVPGVEVSFRHSSRERLREIGSFGAWNFLMALNAFVYQHVPNILIAWLMPVAAVGHYALATGLSRQLNSLLAPVPQVVYPAAAAMHVRGDHEGLERLYHDASRLTMLVMIPLVLVAWFWTDDFYRLWIGEQYLSQSTFYSVAGLFRILLIASVTGYSSTIAQQILIGAGLVRSVATLLITGSVISLSCSLLFLPSYGLVAIASATVMASVVVDLIAMPLLLQRRLGLRVSAFLGHSCVRPVAAGALQALLMVGIRLTSDVTSWMSLMRHGVLAGIGSGAVIAVLGLTTEERQRFLVRPIARAWERGVLRASALLG